MAEMANKEAQPRPRPRRRLSLDWLPVLPFFIYVTLFLAIPALWLVIDAFKSDAGGFTTANVAV